MRSASLALVAALILASSLSVLRAAELTEAEVRSTVQDFLQRTQSYQASFHQQVVDENGGLVEEGAGQFWLQRPGQLRWHYDLPWERDIAVSESKIWMYDAELEQLTIRSAAGALTATPAALLVGDVDALDSYRLSGASGGDSQASASTDIRLQPISAGGDFSEIGLVFANNLLRQLILSDRFGQRTLIEFSDIQVNQPIDPARFEVSVPEGADVIDESEP